MTKKIKKFFVVNLQKCAFDHNICFRFSFFYFIENETDHPRNDSKLILFNTDGITAAHSMSFATSSLPICKNSSIITLKATKNKIFDAYIKYIFLLCVNIKDFIKFKFTFFNYQLIRLLIAFCANGVCFRRFASH